MGGKLGVESKPGSGSEFWLDLPWRLAPPSKLKSPPSTLLAGAQGASLCGVWTGSRRVLVVEDNPTNRLIAQRALERLGYAVWLANDGESALRIVDRETVDLILMDCHMPGLDGFETTRRIRQSASRHIPIVALTAAVFEEDRRAASEAGMDGLIAKPFALDELRNALERYVPAYPESGASPLDPAAR
jgi:CheY-like chemotaxis protein